MSTLHSYPAFEFTKTEAKLLRQKLKKHPKYKTRTKIGPHLRKQCIVIEDQKSIRIRNPFHSEGRGPERLNAKQIEFIWVHRHLPDNSEVTEQDFLIELSHVCGNKDCINSQGKHIKAEERWINLQRVDHHEAMDDDYDDLLSKQNNDKKNKRNFRESTKKNSSLVCQECLGCTLEPTCFKNRGKAD